MDIKRLVNVTPHGWKPASVSEVPVDALDRLTESCATSLVLYDPLSSTITQIGVSWTRKKHRCILKILSVHQPLVDQLEATRLVRKEAQVRRIK